MTSALDRLDQYPEADRTNGAVPLELLRAATEELRGRVEQAAATTLRIEQAAAGRPMTARQREDHQAAQAVLKRDGELLEQLERDLWLREEGHRQFLNLGGLTPHPDNPFFRGHQPVITGLVGSGSEYRDGVPLGPGQSMAGFVRARGLDRGGYGEGLSLRKYLRGLVAGDWHDADRERRAMAEGTMAGGGHMVPTPLAAELIDLARNQTRVLQAGARTVPMTSQTLKIAKWTGDPEPGWRGEAELIPQDDATLDAVTLTARSLSVLVKFSRELVQDAPGIEQQLRAVFAQKMALSLDYAALFGTGADNQPTGVVNTPGVATTTLGTNGTAVSGYSFLVDAVGALDDANEQATAAITSPRVVRDLTSLTDTTGQPLQRPPYLDGLLLLGTNQVPTDQTVGTATNASTVIVGDWRQLYIGMREQLTLIPLVERYADTGELALIAHIRADVAVARTAAFHVVAGVLPAADAS